MNDNIKFFKEQFRKRQRGINTILRKESIRPLMSNNNLNKMIAQNIRGLDPDSAQREIERLNIINSRLGYELPEKQRIEKLIYAKGRDDLQNPTLNISESINRLGDRLVPKPVNIGVTRKSFQFLIDIAHNQNVNNFTSDELLVVDLSFKTLARYDVYSVEGLKKELDISDDLLKILIKQIFTRRLIIMYINPHDVDSKNLLTRINYFATRGNLNNLTEKLGITQKKKSLIEETILDPKDIPKEVVEKTIIDPKDIPKEVVEKKKLPFKNLREAINRIESFVEVKSNMGKSVIKLVEDLKLGSEFEELISKKLLDSKQFLIDLKNINKFSNIVKKFFVKGELRKDIKKPTSVTDLTELYYSLIITKLSNVLDADKDFFIKRSKKEIR